MKQAEITLDLIRAARARITGRIRHTPVLESEILNTLAGAELYFKCENLQEGGAFKARGAINAVFSIPDDELRAGVVTHSSGNHGAALARAARLRGVRARIVMPENSSAAKFEAVRGYGGEIVRCAVGAREATAAQIVAETGAVFIHPYDDPRVIAGQGTIALELLDELPDLECLLLPGGWRRPGQRRCHRREGHRALDPCGRGRAGRQRTMRSAPFGSGTLTRWRSRQTIADGLRGDRRASALSRSSVAQLDDIVTVGEEAIVRAMRTLWQHLKMIVEASSAVPYAAVLEEYRRRARIACRYRAHRRQRRSGRAALARTLATLHAGHARTLGGALSARHRCFCCARSYGPRPWPHTARCRPAAAWC